VLQNWNDLWNKKIKAKRLLYYMEREALKIKENQTKFSRFKAHLEDNFVKVLSFEITIPVAWTRIDR
jgi:hypothetical protein